MKGKPGRKWKTGPQFTNTIGLTKEAHTKLTELSKQLMQTRAQIASDIINQYYETCKHDSV